VFDFVAKTVNYSNIVISSYPLNNVSEGGAFNNQSALWSPIPTPDLNAQGAGGAILPVLTTVNYAPPAPSRGQQVLGGSVVIAIICAIGGALWVYN